MVPCRSSEGVTVTNKILIISQCYTETQARGLPLLGSCLAHKRRIQARDTYGGNEIVSLFRKYTQAPSCKLAPSWSECPIGVLGVLCLSPPSGVPLLLPFADLGMNIHSQVFLSWVLGTIHTELPGLPACTIVVSLVIFGTLAMLPDQARDCCVGG